MTLMSLLFIGQQLTIYIGFFLLVAGVVGNGINILIFATENTYRLNPCTFYFLIGSINNLAFILFSLLTRILTTGFGMSFLNTVSIWCRLRQYFSVVPNVISITCSCLATIDQFFVTSRRPSFRRLSHIKRAHRTVLITIIIWALHGTPIFFYQNISPLTSSCTITDPIYAIYSSIYLLGFVCIIPILIMVTFTWLTYRNMHRITNLAEQHVDRQFVRMTSIQVLLVVISFLPYGILTSYGFVTVDVNKDIDRKLIEYLLSANYRSYC